MSKSDLKHMVSRSLKGTGERMIELAQTIGEGGDRLGSADRKLVKMAMIPALEEVFSELIHFYMLDALEMQSESFHQLDRLLGLRF